MRIAEYKQTGIKNGFPVMSLVYRDATEEEVAAMEYQKDNIPARIPTLDEQVSDLTDLVGVLAEVICNG